MSYYRLLQRNPQFRRVWFSQVVSELGDWCNFVALLQVIARFSMKAQTMGLLLIIQALPFVLLSPLAGFLADRFDRRKVMIFSDLGRALIVLGFIFIDDPKWFWILYVLAALQFSLASFFEPARSALISNVVKGEDLISANALSSATWSVMFTLGAALGGLLTFLLPLKIAFVLNAATFLLSAGCLTSIRGSFRAESDLVKSQDGSDASTSQSRRQSIFAWILPVVNLFKQSPKLLAISLIKSGLALTGGVMWLLAGIYGERIFPMGKGGSLSLGILYGMMGIGAILGSLWLQRFAEYRKQFAVIVFWFYLGRVLS